jgi:hypothetical protein
MAELTQQSQEAAAGAVTAVASGAAIQKATSTPARTGAVPGSKPPAAVPKAAQPKQSFAKAKTASGNAATSGARMAAGGAPVGTTAKSVRNRN